MKLSRLDELADVVDSLHQTPVYQPYGISMVRVTDIKPGFLDLSGTVRVSDEVYKEFTRNHKPRSGDIVFSRVGTYGITSLVSTDEPFCLGQNTAVIVPKVNGRYLYYCLQSSFIKQQIEETVVGSTQKTISLKNIREIKIPLFESKTIDAIAHILGTLDDKIELNRRMNETLEALARAIFKSWFVDFDPVRAKMEGRQPAGMDAETAALFPGEFEDSALGQIPKGWKVGKLGNLCEVTIGGDWGEDNAHDSLVEVICLRGVDLEKLRQNGYSDAPIRWIKAASLEKRLMNDCDVLIAASGIGPVGRSLWVNSEILKIFSRPVIYSNFCKRLRAQSPAYAVYVDRILHDMRESNEIWEYVNGTSIPNLDEKGLLSGYQVVIPSVNVLESYFRFMQPIYSRLYSLESRTLATLRDTLLPKLLSGEVRIEALSG